MIIVVSVTLSVPADVKHKMDHFSEINWSGFVRKKIIEKTEELSWMEEMKKKIHEESGITDWAIKVQKIDRQERLRKLEEKGLI